MAPGDEAWLEFKGAAHTAEVYLNGEKLCHHEGGYSAFRVKLETLGAENTLAVSVDNSDNDHVYPQKADFTFYGGLYRDVSLIIVPASHFELGYCGTPGIKVTPVVDLAAKRAQVTVETWQTGADSVTIEAAGQKQTVPSVEGHAKAVFTLENVHLWDGVDDPVSVHRRGRAAQRRRHQHAFWLPEVRDRPAEGILPQWPQLPAARRLSPSGLQGRGATC